MIELIGWATIAWTIFKILDFLYLISKQEKEK